MDLYNAFPQLKTEGYVKTSARDITYNCIGFAAETNLFWWPDPNGQYYWPDQVPRKCTIHAFVQAFKLIGYKQCQDDTLELKLVKVAIFANGNIPTHAARQLDDGRWTSKLGRSIDITHALRGLEGDEYGKVVQLLSKPKDSN